MLINDDGSDGEGVLLGEADRTPQSVGIVENDVDAGELVENHEADSHPHDGFKRPTE